MTFLKWSELDSRLFSPKLWAKFAPPSGAGFERTASGNPAIGMFDDFIGFGGILASTAGAYQSGPNRYLSYQTASTTIIPVAATPTPATVAPTTYGAIALTPTATDGDTVGIAWGASLVAPYHAAPFSVIPGISKDLVFEARFKIASIAVDLGNFFVGLVGAAGVLPVATAIPITSSDAFATTNSLLGFGRLAAATTGATGLYYERAGGTVAAIAAVATLVANTYIKLGYYWEAATRRLIPYVDGEPLGSAYHITPAIAGATPWPNDYMMPVAVVEEKATTALTLTMDWWACAQMI